MFFVADGKLENIKIHQDEEPVSLNIYEMGDLVGELNLLYISKNKVIKYNFIIYVVNRYRKSRF